jgi:chemotaxis protein methyltransferase CheR
MSSLFSKTISLRKELKISDAEFMQLRDFIYSQSGIYVADSRKYLVENRLASRLKDLHLNSFAEYHYYLQYDPGRRQELNRLFEVITTNETSFYR